MAKLYFKVGSDWEEVVKLRNEISKLKQELKSMDGTQSPVAFKALNTQLAASTQRMDELVINAARAGAVMEGDFKKKIFDASQTVNGFTEKIIAQKNAIGSLQTTIRKNKELYKNIVSRGNEDKELLNYIREQEKALSKERDVLFSLTQQQANARLSVKKLRDEYALYQNDGKQVVETNNGIAISWKKALAVIGGAAALKHLSSEILRVRGEFQSMQTAMETMVGKDVAGPLMAQVKELAKISPLTMTDMVGAEKMMLGFNIQAGDTIKYLKALSDISMGESGKFNSLTLAFSQMSTAGKLMGQDLNQMINAGFNPLQQLSEKTGKSMAVLKEEMSKGAISAEMVQQAFLDATAAGGKFYNMSENASKTINGQISMMQDALDNVFNELGTKGESVIMSGIQATTSLIQNYETVGKVLTGLMVTYGAYRTAVMLVTAAESKHTLVEIGLTNVRVLARKAQLALNASMLTNPYVLLAVAVGGLITANLTLIDTTRQLKAAEDDYNKTKNEAITKEQEYKAEIDKYLSVAENDKAATRDRKDALVELVQKYPAVFEKYKTEAEMLQHILEIKKQINAIDNANSSANPVNELNDVNKQIADLEKLARQRYHGGRGLTNAENSKLEMLKNKRSELEGTLKKEETNAILTNLTGYSNSQLEAAIKDRERLLAKMQLKGASKGTITGKSILSGTFTKEELEGQKKLLEATKAEREAEKRSSAEWLSFYKKTYEDADKAYNDFLKSKEVMSDTDRDKELKRLKGLRDTAKATYESKGGSVSSDKKDVSASEKLRKEQEKYNLLINKQALEKKRQIEDLENQLTQTKINKETDGFKRVQLQRELDNKKEIQNLERQKEDYIRTIIQLEKEKFDAKEDLIAKQNPKHVKETFDPSTVKVNTSVFDGIIGNTSKKQINDKIREQEDSWNEYLTKYGTFQQKKAAIEQKYQSLIKEAPDAGKAAALQKEWEESLANLNLSKLKQDINWEVVFGDMSKVAKKQLQHVKKQLQDFKKSPEFKNATPEQIKVMEEALNNINNALVDKGGFFGGISESLNEYEQSVIKVKEAQEELEKVLKSGDEAAIEKAKNKKNTAEANQVNAQTNVEKSKDKAISNITSVSNAIVQLGKENVSLSDIGNTVGALVDTLSASGTKIGGIISAILSIIDAAGEVGTFQYGMDIIENISSTVTDAFARDTEAITGLDMSFMKSADYDDYNELVEEYGTLLDVWDQLLDKKKAYIKESYGAEVTKVGQEALDILNSEREITKELASSRLDAGKSAGSHSINYRMWKGSYDYNGTNWKDVAGDISKALGGVDFSNMWSMLNMSAEQLEWIKTNYTGLWANMDGDFRGYLDDIIKYGDTEKDIINSINEQLTQMSFDSLFDSFLNTLMDMDASSKDFADNFEEYMRKAIFTSMFAKNYEGVLEDWYEAFAEANKKEGGITASDVKDLRNKWDDIVNGALSDREAWEQIVGSSGASTSQSSSQKGFAAMSQDTGEELNGRFTALQVAGEEIKNQNIIQSQSLNLLTMRADDILRVNTDMRNIADNTRDLIANSYLELVQISENTGNSAKYLKDIKADISEVKKNTSKL